MKGLEEFLQKMVEDNLKKYASQKKDNEQDLFERHIQEEELRQQEEFKYINNL